MFSLKVIARAFILLLALISGGLCTRDHRAVDCFSHEVLHGSSNTTIADRDSLDISFRTNEDPILLFKSASNSTLFKVSLGNCHGSYNKCLKLRLYSNNQQEHDEYTSQYEDKISHGNTYTKIHVSWEGNDIRIDIQSLMVEKKKKTFLERPEFLEIESSDGTLLVKENECSRRRANVYNWRLIFHQYKTTNMDPVTDNPLDNYFRNLTNMNEFNLFNRPFEFVLQWDNLPKWQMWSQESDPTVHDQVFGYADIDVNYHYKWSGLRHRGRTNNIGMSSEGGFAVDVQNRGSTGDTSFRGPFVDMAPHIVNEVFLHVRVLPLCKLNRVMPGSNWNNIHRNCKKNGSYRMQHCIVCGKKAYEQKSCTKVQNSACKRCKTCSKETEYEVSSCDTKKDTQCSQCEDRCERNEYAIKPCTKEGKFPCRTCHTICPVGQYKKGSCREDGYFRCEDCSKTCKENQYIKQNCTQENDIICETCTTTCDSDQYIKEKCTGTKDALCAKCNPCPSNFYPSGGCNGTHDTLCTSCGPLCSEGFYELQECNATHPRICVVCSPECSEGFYELQECNATHPRICDVCSPECSEGFYELQECNATHPRICSQCTECQHPMSFISTNCSKHSDTVCSSLRNNFSRSKKKQQAPYNFILTIIIFSGILGLLCIVLVVGYVYRQRSKRVHDENEIYADPKTFVMTENLFHKAPISLQGEESNYSDSIGEIQYDSWDDVNNAGLYSSLNAQNPKFDENDDASTSKKINAGLPHVQQGEYSALNINVDIPEKVQYSALDADVKITEEYSDFADHTAINNEANITDDNYSVSNSYSAEAYSDKYSTLNETIEASCEYSVLSAKGAAEEEKDTVPSKKMLEQKANILCSKGKNGSSCEYSALRAECVAEYKYSTLNEIYNRASDYSVVNEKDIYSGVPDGEYDQQLYSTLDENEHPKPCNSSLQDDTNYANLSIIEDDTTWYSDVTKERVYYTSIKNENEIL